MYNHPFLFFLSGDGGDIGDKFPALWQMATALLRHSDQALVASTQDTLLLSVAHWSLTLGSLESVVATEAVQGRLGTVRKSICMCAAYVFVEDS